MAVVKRVDADMDAVRPSGGTDGEVATLVTTDVHRVAYSITSVTCPHTDILGRDGLEFHVGIVFQAKYFPIGPHIHCCLADIAFQNQLPRSLWCFNVASVNTSD